MAVYCPIVEHKVVYLTCQECEDKVCQKRTDETISSNETSQRDAHMSDKAEK